MSKKQEEEALTSLQKLDELTQDILKNDTNGGDPNFRHLIFTGLTQTKNQVLLDKMKDLLFVDEEEDLKKTIILGIFNHKELYAPVIEYGEYAINMPYLDESYNNKDSYLLVLDALFELAYKNKLNEFESAIPLMMQLYKLACSEKSTSVLADKLLQQFLNSQIGKVKPLQQEFIEVIKNPESEVNTVVIAIDILARVKYEGIFIILEEILDKLEQEQENLACLMPLFDIVTLALSYYNDLKFNSKVKKLLKKARNINLSNVKDMDEIIARIKSRVKKINERLNSQN